MDDLWADENFVNSPDEFVKKDSPGITDEMYGYGRIYLVDSMVGEDNNDIILDIGCGMGYTLQRHNGARALVGMDISNSFCKAAKKTVTNGEIILASMNNLPFKDNTFDKIIAIYSVVYSPYKENTFAEISRILKEKGTFVLYDPNRLSLRTMVRKMSAMKLQLYGDLNNPRFIHHSIATKQAMSYWNFKKIGMKSHLTIDKWCGVFSYHMIIPQKFRSFVFKHLHYKNWGFIWGIKFFSDFLIIKFLKNSNN